MSESHELQSPEVPQCTHCLSPLSWDCAASADFYHAAPLKLAPTLGFVPVKDMSVAIETNRPAITSAGRRHGTTDMAGKLCEHERTTPGNVMQTTRDVVEPSVTVDCSARDWRKISGLPIAFTQGPSTKKTSLIPGSKTVPHCNLTDSLGSTA